MKAGGGGAADGISTNYPFKEELLKDVADGLHDFFSFSSCRVSWMNCPILSILSATGKVRCFSRQRGMPRSWTSFMDSKLRHEGRMSRREAVA
jgi:hypothetical protein